MSKPYAGSSTQQGVAGLTGTNAAGGVGVSGESDSGRAISGESTNGQAIWGHSQSQVGVIGVSEGFDGVWGESHAEGFSGVSGRDTHPKGGNGVWGSSDAGRGVTGLSVSGQAIYGHSQAQAGVVGESDGFDGVYGVSNHAEHAGVSGHNSRDGLAGWFGGKVVITRDLEVAGDVVLANADIAEDFQVANEALDPGTVLCVGDDEQLRPCDREYDGRVVGVLSGAGEFRPGIILDRTRVEPTRGPVALTGRVYCKADASDAPIHPGDQLTTSAITGHAMRAEAQRAPGAVLGKALRSLPSGRGLIPILVTLQ
jgi:hypothetical protein